MALLAGLILASLLIGYLAGGTPKHFEHLQLAWPGLAIAGLALQLAPTPSLFGLTPDVIGPVMLVTSYVLLIAFAGANVRMPGFPIIVVGLVLNVAVIGANGGMPVSGAALERSGSREELAALQDRAGAKHHLMDPNDVLAPLADVISFGAPVNAVLSLGDLFAYGGVALMLISVMRGRMPRPVPRGYWGKHRPKTWRTTRFLPPTPARFGRPPAIARWGTGR